MEKEDEFTKWKRDGDISGGGRENYEEEGEIKL